VGARLVGDDVDGESPAHELGQHGRAIADEADRSAEALGLRRLAPGDGVVEVVGHLVQVPVLDPALQPLGIDVDDQAHALVQGDGERLCTSHPPQPPVTVKVPANVPPKRLAATAAKVS